jgi:hypothetical protein
MLIRQVVLATLLLPVIAGGESADDLRTVQYRGSVTDVLGGPLPTVDVTCTQGQRVIGRVRTDERGEYVLTSRNGTCSLLSFEIEGFVPERFQSPGGDALDVVLLLGVVGEVVSLGPLKGSVTNADGSPAADASVWLRRAGGDLTEGSRTDAKGRFAMPIRGLQGEFTLCARTKEPLRFACTAFGATDDIFRDGVHLHLLAPPATGSRHR